LFENNGIPLYIQLKNKLLKDIKKNYSSNDKLPPESKLIEIYKVSRITVRKAMDELERDGLIIKKQGKGTYVKERKILYDATSIGSFTQRFSKQNHALKTKSIEYKIITNEHYVKDLLKCDTLLLIKRFRVLDGVPFSLMLNYFDIKRVPNIQEKFQIQSLYTFLKNEYGIEFHKAIETVEARSATKKEAKILETKKNSPLLSLHRLSYDEKLAPIEFSDIVIKADMYKHKIMLSREQQED